MKNNLIKKIMPVMFAVLFFCTFGMTANATQTEETNQAEEQTEESRTEEREATALTFEIGNFTYEMLTEATQEDMPNGFTISDWEYNGVAVKAGVTENSDMICVMGEDWETGYQYRFIYDPNHEMFTPYFGTDIKNGYIYTIPLYEDAEVPYGFEEAYYVIQTVPMFVFQREDAELTQEEIALGILSDDNYLVFLMMDENGNEIHYTYDLIDRTYQRALLQKKDAERVTEVNELNDKLHEDIAKLNADNAERMNKRLTLIGILVALVVIMAGVIINLLIKISKLQKETVYSERPEEDEKFEEEERPEGRGVMGFFLKKKEASEEEDFEEEDDFYDKYEDKKTVQKAPEKAALKEDDDLEILDLDLDDL